MPMNLKEYKEKITRVLYSKHPKEDINTDSLGIHKISFEEALGALVNIF